MVQAVGGSMLNPVAMSIITNTFTDPAGTRPGGRDLGAVVGVSIALGPVLGGVLVTSVGWRSIFWINLPVGSSAIVLALRFIPESKAPHPRRFDPVGQALVFVPARIGDLRRSSRPPTGAWSRRSIVASIALAVGALIGLIVYEPRRREPLIDLRFFHSIPFAGATAIAVAAFAAFGGFLFLNTLYLQGVRGLSPLDAGLATLPLASGQMVLAPVSGGSWGRAARGCRSLGAGVAAHRRAASR